MRVRYDDERIQVFFKPDPEELEEDKRYRRFEAAEIAPYWHGVDLDDGYSRYLALWSVLRERFGGTSYWNGDWGRLSREEFRKFARRFDELSSRHENYPSLSLLDDRLLARYEELVYDDEGRP